MTDWQPQGFARGWFIYSANNPSKSIASPGSTISFRPVLWRLLSRVSQQPRPASFGNFWTVNMSTVCWSAKVISVGGVGGWGDLGGLVGSLALFAFSACLSDLTHRKDNEILIMRRLAGCPGTVPPSVGRTAGWVAMKLASFRRSFENWGTELNSASC